MHPSARLFALRAAAKVTLSVSSLSVFGCGGLVEEVKPDPTPLRADHDAATYASDAGPDVGNACSATPVPLDGGASQEMFDCCLPVLNAAMPADAGWSTTFAPEHASDPSVNACCHEVIAHLEGDRSTGSATDDYSRAAEHGVLQACCRMNMWATPTCTPWGPPAPPAFSEVA